MEKERKMVKKILPPTYLLLAILFMVALHFLYPGAAIIPPPWNLLGVVPIGFGVWINIIADQALHRAQTTVKPFEEPTALIIDGVYGISRHPMYLGFVAILIGIAVLLGSLAPCVMVVIFAVLMDVVFIRVEEQNMARKFGQDWLVYTRTVRRWI
jgi:protein-S-isoprenylcysteine O-methyltransferase Ste14